MSETAKGAASGAVQGAAAGAAVGSVVPGIGTAVGAVVGAVVGGVWGAIGGSFGDKAKKKARLAKAIQKQREEEAYRQQYLSLIRQSRIQRASSLAAAVAMGSEEGSGAQGALASIGSQIANQVEYMSVDRAREVQVTQLMGKAEKLSKKSSDTMGALSTTATVVGLAGAAYGMAGAMSAANASNAAIEAGSASVNGGTGIAGGTISQATGFGSSAAYSSLQTTGLSAGMMGPIAPTAANWSAASASLMSRAMLSYTTVQSGVQIGRAIYSGTRVQ